MKARIYTKLFNFILVTFIHPALSAFTSHTRLGNLKADVDVNERTHVIEKEVLYYDKFTEREGKEPRKQESEPG